jgi:hypothetical protein
VRRRLWLKRRPCPGGSSLGPHASDAALTTAAASLGGGEEVVEDRAAAKQVFFEVLARVGKRRGVWGTLGLLDGTAWLRTMRRDTELYRAWLRKRVLAVVRVGGGGGWLVAYPAPTSPAPSTRGGRTHSPGGTAGGTAGGTSDGTSDGTGHAPNDDRPTQANGATGAASVAAVGAAGVAGSEPPLPLPDAEDLPSELDGGASGDDHSSGRPSGEGAVTGSGAATQPRGRPPEQQAWASPASPEALRELSCGALHACASYGYPMAKGWLASVHAGAALLTWRRMTGVLNKVLLRYGPRPRRNRQLLRCSHPFGRVSPPLSPSYYNLRWTQCEASTTARTRPPQ